MCVCVRVCAQALLIRCGVLGAIRAQGFGCSRADRVVERVPWSFRPNCTFAVVLMVLIVLRIPDEMLLPSASAAMSSAVAFLIDCNGQYICCVMSRSMITIIETVVAPSACCCCRCFSNYW